MHNSIDKIRVLVILCGVTCGVLVFLKYGDWFTTTDFFKSSIATLFSILIGFQTALFALLPKNSSEAFVKKVNKNKARRTTDNRFNRQFFLFWCFLSTLFLMAIAELIVCIELKTLFERITASLAISTLIWASEIPRLILEVRND